MSIPPDHPTQPQPPPHASPALLPKQREPEPEPEPDTKPADDDIDDINNDPLTTSATHRAAAKPHFLASDFTSASQRYERALAALPLLLDDDAVVPQASDDDDDDSGAEQKQSKQLDFFYRCTHESALVRANLAVCALKVGEWKVCERRAGEALGEVGRLSPYYLRRSESDDDDDGDDDGVEVKGEGGRARAERGQKDERKKEVVVEVDGEMAARMESLSRCGICDEDVQKLRIKCLLRRARAREELGGWGDLSGAEEDYKTLSSLPLSPPDTRILRAALASLPAKLEAAKAKEMGEMMGKLRQLGDGILKPFGLSTDNFNFVKDEKGGGGYSVNFDQGAGGR